VVGNTVSVGIGGSGLTAAQSPCTGQVPSSFPAPPTVPINVGVTVNITNVSLTVSPLRRKLQLTRRDPTPFRQNQTVSLGTSNASAVAYSINVTSANGVNFLPLHRGRQHARDPEHFLESGSGATLGQGTYTGAATSPRALLQNATINVTLTVTATAGRQVLSTVVNAATNNRAPSPLEN